MEGVRDGEGLHRPSRVVAQEPSAGSGRVVVPRSQGRLSIRDRCAGTDRRAMQMRPLVLPVHRLSCPGWVVRSVLPVVGVLTAYHEVTKVHENNRRKGFVSLRELRGFVV